MNLGDIFNFPLTIGRKTIGYLATDPAGEISLLGGYFLMDNSLIFSIPLFLFSAYHIPKMINVRKKLDERVKINDGLSEKVIEPFNNNSWCSNRVAIAYAFGQGRYKEFKQFLNRYSLPYYIKKQEGDMKIIAKNFSINLKKFLKIK